MAFYTLTSRCAQHTLHRLIWIAPICLRSTYWIIVLYLSKKHLKNLGTRVCCYFAENCTLVFWSYLDSSWLMREKSRDHSVSGKTERLLETKEGKCLSSLLSSKEHELFMKALLSYACQMHLAISCLHIPPPQTIIMNMCWVLCVRHCKEHCIHCFTSCL